MNSFKKALWVVAACVACVLPANAQLLDDENRIQKVVESHSGALVRIKASVALPEVDGEKKKGTLLRLGTGFFITSDGLIVTNASVVYKAQRLWYEVDGVPYLAVIKGIDASTNVALLQAKTMPEDFSSVNLSDTITPPGVGSLLVKMSLPMEFGPTPSLGLMQGADSDFGARAFPTRYWRVQLGAGPGEAGAPVFDLKGRFVGMTVATVPEVGASYVLGARALNWVREGILASSDGHRIPSSFGFNAQEVKVAGEGLSLEVKSIADNSAASKAGLKVGDRIVMAAAKPCATIADLRDAVFFTKPGQYLDLKVMREDKSKAIALLAEAGEVPESAE